MAERGLPDVELTHLSAAMQDLRAAALEAEDEFAVEIEGLAPDARPSARNLAHYTGIRRHDLRPLQEELAALGLSSLGRMEAHVLPTLEAVTAALQRMQGKAPLAPTAFREHFDAGRDRLSTHADQLLGTTPADRGTPIMVTCPRKPPTTGSWCAHCSRRPWA